MKRDDGPEKFNSRLALVGFFVWVVFGLITVRLWHLQGIKGSYYRDLSENNRTRTVRTVAPRGMIFDRDGRVLVRNRPAFDVALLLADTPDVDGTLVQLAEITGREYASLQEQFKKAGRYHPFQPKVILSDVSREELARIKVNAYQLPGVIISAVPMRSYPAGEVGSHLFGYAREITKEQLNSDWGKGYRIGDTVGQTGLERVWEKKIRGRGGFIRVEVDARGNRRQELGIAEDKPGSDLHLTIDLDLQREATAALKDKKGAVIALDPNNGEVLTLVSSPAADANLFAGRMASETWRQLSNDKARPLRNRVIANTYPPGSTVKLFYALAALAENKITAERKLDCPGFYYFAGRRYHCHKRTGHGNVNLREAIRMSCNAYFFQLGQILGIDNIHKYGKLFGFGEVTEVGLLGEERGIMPSPDWKLERVGEKWYPGDTLPVSIGQGYLIVTPMQLAVAVATLANGGTRYEPMLVKEITDQSTGASLTFKPKVVANVSGHEKLFAKVREFAGDVVQHPRGTGKRAALEGIMVGGKTGTAQVTALGSEGDNEELQDHAWFVAFAPVEDPQIALAIIVENSGHGGVAAAPISKRLMKIFFEKKGFVFPEEEVEEDKVQVQVQDEVQEDVGVVGQSEVL